MFVLEQRTATLLAACRRNGLRLAVAESCSGGRLAVALTSHPGASDTFVGGSVVYADRSKTAILGVPPQLLAKHGAVSKEVALAMTKGTLQKLEAGLALAITGIAGPGGDSSAKSVGLVHIAAERPGKPPLHRRQQFQGGREAVRLQSALAAVTLGLRLLP